MTSVWIVYYMTCQEVSIIYGVFDNQEAAEACRQQTHPEPNVRAHMPDGSLGPIGSGAADYHADIMEVPFNACLLDKPAVMG